METRHPRIMLSDSDDSLNAYQVDLDHIDFKQDTALLPTLLHQKCVRCLEGFEMEMEVIQCGREQWHKDCFACAQCFQPFPEGIYYEFGDRKYCEHDFQVLYAPCCHRCNMFVIGRVIKAMNASWHADCFRCELCDKCLSDEGFVKNMGRALCHACNTREKAQSGGRRMCHKCGILMDEGEQLKVKAEFYHPYHFNCHACGQELNVHAREKAGELYCLRCHDKMGVAICGACRRPIEERVVFALGKAWHVEHFMCAHCEKPFLGSRHFERHGQAYCELHYQQLFGELCHRCHQITGEEKVLSMNKAWCAEHFLCTACDKLITADGKFYEYDLRPVCKKCYEKFPTELRKRLAKMHKGETGRA